MATRMTLPRAPIPAALELSHRIISAALVVVNRTVYLRGYENGYMQARIHTHAEMLEAIQRDMTQEDWALAAAERDLHRFLDIAVDRLC